MTGGKGSTRKLPNRDESILLLQESGCSEGVVRHCIVVSDLAVRIAKRCAADVELVEAGSLLHDLGRCRSHGVDHAGACELTLGGRGPAPEGAGGRERQAEADAGGRHARQRGAEGSAGKKMVTPAARRPTR